MFWHSAANSNAIDNLLDQPDVKLTTILDQDEVLMEIRGMNKKLIEFLTRPESMCEMLDLITTVPSADIPIPIQYKFPNTACEVLTSDISFAEKIAAEPQLMKKLFHFFRDAEPPVNPLLASYVCRVLGEMIVRKLDQNWYSYQLNLIQIMGYLQSEPNLLDWLLKHLETSSVCDFFHKLVMHVEGQDMRNSLYEWLEVKEQFTMKLVNSMDKLNNREAHMNISRLVGDLLFALQDETSSPSTDRSIDSEPFLLALKSHATFERLLDVIFGDDTLSQSSIVYGLDMLLALLGIAKKPAKPNSKIDTTYDSNEDVMIPGPVRLTLLNKMATLLRFLESPPSTRQPIRLPNGVLNEPLGMERLAIVKFVAHIITLHDVDLNEALIQFGILRKVLDLFWDYPWNNFLHHYVCQIVIQITKITRSNNCAKFIIVEYGLLEKIMEAFDNENLKAGYLGHLAKMSTAIRDSIEASDTMKGVVAELEVKEKFKDFYELKWKEYNAKATQLLAGAPLPSSGVTMSTSNHNYESDPGVTWDSSSGTGLNSDGDNADNDNFFEASSGNFGGADRYDDEKSKAIFEMFCFERSNSGEEEEEDPSFGRSDGGGGISMPFGSEQSEEAEEGFEWRNPNIFFKQLEEQEELFGQLALNGSLTSGDASGDAISTANFIANPWAGQESVQVDTTDPWAAFDFSNNANDKSPEGAGDGVNDGSDNWAKFDQFPTASSENDSFADFTSAVDFFSPTDPTMLTTNTNTTTTSSAINPSATSTEEATPSQL